jgi:type III secretory pathway component EscR
MEENCKETASHDKMAVVSVKDAQDFNTPSLESESSVEELTSVFEPSSREALEAAEHLYCSISKIDYLNKMQTIRDYLNSSESEKHQRSRHIRRMYNLCILHPPIFKEGDKEFHYPKIMYNYYLHSEYLDWRHYKYQNPGSWGLIESKFLNNLSTMRTYADTFRILEREFDSSTQHGKESIAGALYNVISALNDFHGKGKFASGERYIRGVFGRAGEVVSEEIKSMSTEDKPKKQEWYWRAKAKFVEFLDYLDIAHRLNIESSKWDMFVAYAVMMFTGGMAPVTTIVGMMLLPWYVGGPFSIFCFTTFLAARWLTASEKKERRTRRRTILLLLCVLLIIAIIVYAYVEAHKRYVRQLEAVKEAVDEAPEDIRELIEKTSKSREKREIRYSESRPQATADYNAEAQMTSLLKKNVLAFRRMGIAMPSGTATHIGFGIYVTCQHMVHDMNDGDIYTLSHNGQEHVLKWDENQIVHIERSGCQYDVAFFRIVGYQQLVMRSIHKSFVREKDILNLPQPMEGYKYLGMNGVVLHHRDDIATAEGITEIKWMTDFSHQLTYGGKDHDIVGRLLKAKGCPEVGTSGGLWMMRNASMQQKLVGIQYATNKSQGVCYATPLTYEDIQLVMDKFKRIDQEMGQNNFDPRADPTCSFRGECIMEENLSMVRPHQWKELQNLDDHIHFLGFVKPKFAVYSPEDSSYYQSPLLHDERMKKFPPEYSSSSYGIPHLGRGSNKYRDAKLKRRFKCNIADEDILKSAREIALDWGHTSAGLPNVLPLEMACQGVTEHNLKGPHMTTSPGFPWCKYPHNGKAPFFSRIDDDKIELSKDFKDFYLREFLPELFETGYPKEFTTDVSKDEILDAASLNKGKTRRFAPCSIHYWLACQQYFGAWLHMIRNGVPTEGASNMVGINVHGSHWNTVFKFTLSILHLGLVLCDVSGWDLSVPAAIMWGVTEAICYWYILEYGDTPAVRRANKIRRALMKPVYCSVRVMGGLIVVMPNGNTSGNPMTAEINGVANKLMHYLSFKHKAVSVGRDDVAQLWKTAVRAVFYGDDSFIAVNTELAPFFTQQYVVEFMHKAFGMVFTDALKTGNIPKYCPREIATFLKRKIVERNGILWAPMEADNIRQRTLWLRKSAGPWQKALRQNIDSALRDFFQDGEETFEREKEMYNRILHSFGIEPVTLEYQALLKAYRETY